MFKPFYSIALKFMAKLATNKHNPDALNIVMSMPQFEGAIKEVIEATDTDGSIKKVIRFYDGSQTPPV